MGLILCCRLKGEGGLGRKYWYVAIAPLDACVLVNTAGKLLTFTVEQCKAMPGDVS